MSRFIPVILLIGLLTACRDAPGLMTTRTPDISSPVGQFEQVVITLAVTEGSQSRYQSLMELFAQDHPDIQVHLVSVNEVVSPEDDNAIRAIASSFDVFPYSLNRQGDTQYLLDLRPFLALDPQFDTADFLPGLLPPSSEPLWAVPTSAAYQVTYLNKNAFDAAGLSYPELEWTTDDFLATALALTQRNGDEVSQWGYIPGQLRFAPLLATQLTGALVTSSGLRLADPDVVAAMQWLSNLFTVHGVSPWLDEYRPVNRRTGSGPSSSGLINGGMAAMWHSTHLLFNENDENIGAVPVPRSQNGFAAEPILTGFAVSRGTANPEAVWQLLHFLSRQPPQDVGMFSTPAVPARRSVIVATSYWEQIPANLMTVLQYTAENNATPRITYQTSDLLQEALVAHIDDNIPITVVLGQQPATNDTPAELSETETIAVPEVEPDSATDKTQITFITSYLVDRDRFLIEQFQEENPTIVVRVQQPDDTPGINRLSRLAGSDCFTESAVAFQDEEIRAAILPIGPLLELDGSLQIDDFYSLPRSYFIEDGQLLALPAFTIIRLIEFNRRLFQETGVAEPSLDWTLADFLEVAQQMTWGTDDAKQYGYDELSDFLISSGIASFDVQYVDYSPGIPTFNYAATAEMITWYADLVRLGVQPPSANNSGADFSRFEVLLRQEKLAMWPGVFSDIVIAFRENMPLGLDIGIAPFPVGPSGSRGDLANEVVGYYIMANSPHRQACWEWIKFLSRHPQTTATKFSMPALIQTAESAEYIASVGEEIAIAAHAYMESSNPRPNMENISWFYPGHDWLREAYHQVASGEANVDTALANADAKFSQYRQCIINQEAFDNYYEQLECIGTVDPVLRNRYMRPGG